MIPKDPHSLKLIEAASLMGIAWEDRSEEWQMDVLDFKQKGRSVRVIDGRIYPFLTYQQALFCDQKMTTKHQFRDLGIPTPAALILDNTDLSPTAIDSMLQAYPLLVCKPLKGTEGHAVGMNMSSAAAIQQHIEAYPEYREWILEAQVTGDDLRIQVIGGKIAAACIRKPAFVTGDGQSSLAQLIEQRHQLVQKQNPQNQLIVDELTLRLIQEQGLSLDSIPPAGHEVQLKTIANMSIGGMAIDCTDTLHPGYQTWIDQIVKATQLRTFAFDALCDDPAGPPFRHAQALELNAKAQWMHHTFSEVKSHDIPKMILEDLFS